jgi:hypothetical protein
MIPASLFLGFTASIIWCAEVIFWFSLSLTKLHESLQIAM